MDKAFSINSTPSLTTDLNVPANAILKKLPPTLAMTRESIGDIMGERGFFFNLSLYVLREGMKGMKKSP